MEITLKFTLHPELAAKGIKVKAATFFVPEIPRRRSGGLKSHIQQVLESLSLDELLQSPILEEYRRLQKEAGIQEPAAPAEYLLKLIKKSGMLPNINRVVDSYNIVSVEALLSMGAHDISHIKGNLRMDVTDGSEFYIPLGKSEPEKVAPNEYAAIDDEKIICRLDLKQCDQTKCGEDTRNFLVYAQGNAETSEEYVSGGLQKVCENISNFCNGEFQLL